MTPERVKSVFLGARTLNAPDRESYLDAACGTDRALRVEVLSLLDSDTDDRALDTREMQSAAQSLAAVVTGDVGTPAGHPVRIGPYAIRAVLGTGGMGVVYLAEQERPRRQVALKVLRVGAASPAALRRFEHEGQMLARLNHPGIAQIHDAGTADSGQGEQPYVAMELIKGRSLTAFGRTLITRERVELFLKVCEAVQHAHFNGVIHRDLKPANILVNAEGQPKVLDFGVARLTEPQAGATMHTEPGVLVGTLNYMSPEQVAGGSAPLDTRSDVYALGVILYELLAGRLPYEVNARAIAESARIISEQDPAPLSTVSRVLRGDLETICAKALEKDPDRRYQSAAALAEDLRRYLGDEPIVARPATTLYQLRKFARRNKALVGGVAAVFVVLVAGIIATTAQTVVAIGQRDRAEEAEQLAATRLTDADAAGKRARTEADTANAILDFLNSRLLSSADPANARGRDVTIREALDTASASVDEAFGDRPEVEAAVRQTLGNTYRGLGEYGPARAHLEAAVALWRRERGDEDLATLGTLRNLAELERSESRWDEAVAILEPVIAALERVSGPESREVLSAKKLLASVYGDQSRLPEAERLMSEVYATARRVLQPDDPELRGTMTNLAAIYREMGRVDCAEPLWREVHEMDRRNGDEDTPSALTVLNNLGIVAAAQGRLADAAEIIEQVLEGKRRVQGPNHPETLLMMVNLGGVYNELARFNEADPLLRDAIEGLLDVLGESNPNVGHAMGLRVQTLNKSGRFAEAEPVAGRATAIFRATVGPDDERTLSAMNGQAVARRETGDLDGAAALFQEIIDSDRHRNDTGPRSLQVRAGLGMVRAAQGRWEEAEPLLSESLDAMHGGARPRSTATVLFMSALADARVHLGRTAEGDALFAETAEICRSGVGPDRLAGRALAACAARLRDTGRTQEAESTWRDAHTMMVRAWGADHPASRKIAADLGALYEQLGRTEDAATWRDAAR
ncbi:MAG: tetratricopeptide repeat protein [Phycisphaerales bacterium]